MAHCEYLDYTFEVGSCDMDVWGTLKPTSILHICQEVAYMHSTKLGFGFERLQETNTAWVLSRIKVEIDHLPVWHDKITVRTWHKRQSGLFSLRDYIFYDELQQPIIKVTSSWLTINIATRRITRIDRIFNSDDTFNISQYPHDAIAIEAERIEMPQQKVAARDHLVAYSDLDVNNHVNNARYMEWACDNSPQQMDNNSHLSSFILNFNHEATYGELVTLSTAQLNPNSIHVEGSVSGKGIFTALLNYCDA
ncbi:MAG: acyl-ACP thioesterase domain-containing protein [Rikenellaceae bacterium]